MGGVRTPAATLGTFEVDLVPQTGQCPEIAGAELPHWGQFIIGLFLVASRLSPNRGHSGHF